MKKDLTYYINLSYPITIEQDLDDGETYFSLEIPDLPGCGAHGPSFEAAYEKLQVAKELWIEESLNRGLNIPEPVEEESFSGKFLLRLPARLHMNLSKSAKTKNISLNQYVKSLLEKSDIVVELERQINKNTQKLLGVIESQNKMIERLENRLEAIERYHESKFVETEITPTSLLDNLIPKDRVTRAWASATTHPSCQIVTMS